MRLNEVEKLFSDTEAAEPEPMKREEILEQYQRTFTVINRKLFNNELPPIMIDYPEGDPEKWAWLKCAACFSFIEKTQEPVILLQFIFGPEYGISTEDIDDLCHELIHYFCYLHDIKDMDRDKAEQYHNMDFKKTAETFGATCKYLDDAHGYTDTHWPDNILAAIFDEI